MSTENERERLEEIAKRSRYAVGSNAPSVAYSFKVMSRFLAPGRILEMGPAEGIMSDHLATLGMPLTVVEAGAPFCESISARHPDVEVVHSLFEDYVPATRFQSIILGHVLEHVVDPVDILRRAAEWLEPNGRIIAAVPNARSVHRQAAVVMGLLPFEEALNESDIGHGHRRVYNPESFRREFYGAGLEIEYFGGYWLKPLADAQIMQIYTDAMIDAFMRMGERYPDIAGEIYVVAKRPD